jgi:hypothetical protein
MDGLDDMRIDDIMPEANAVFTTVALLSGDDHSVNKAALEMAHSGDGEQSSPG